MKWWRIPVLGAVTMAAALLVACARSPNLDGWWDEGIHAVDGYWVTEERHCSLDHPECGIARDVAMKALRASQPEAVVTNAWTASYPNRRGGTANEITHNVAGLVQPRAVILDLKDGTRRLITLSCGAFDGGGKFDCQPASYDLWKVGYRETPAP